MNSRVNFDELCFALRDRVPVEQLRQTYDPRGMASITRSPPGLLSEERVTVILRHIFTANVPTAWMLDVLGWLYDECEVALEVAFTLYELNVVDWISRFGWVDRSPMAPTCMTAAMDFFLRRGIRPLRGLDECLMDASFVKMDSLLCQRLLDAGATPSALRPRPYSHIYLDAAGTAFKKQHEDIVRQLYATRLACRASCIAVLSLRRKSRLIRRYLPVDVLRLIARHVWDYYRFTPPDRTQLH